MSYFVFKLWIIQSTLKRYFIIRRQNGTIKDRNGVDLTEAEDIKKRWQWELMYTRGGFMLMCGKTNTIL